MMSNQKFGGDEDNPITPNPEDTGGPEAGNYAPDPNMPIPGEGESIDNSSLGG